eukprot:scaffold1955_cov68-Cyclotella_meneghiniana.AAC.3
MPRPTMLPPAGYAYPPLPQGSYPMRYQQQQQQNGCPPPSQFQNPHPEKEIASYPPQRHRAPAFNNANASKHDVLVDQLINDAEQKAKHQSIMPPPLPTQPVHSTTTAPKAKKKSKRKSKDYDDGPNKKPPRPYTEYNIFFQLERERIIVDLEKSNRAKEQGGLSADPEEEGETQSSSNQPSDPNDILPRPPRFAHLKLLPKWYDSTHRLAENKKNKEKRKHRKTHGLVSFLDLTRRIAKEWSEASDDVKAYCREVSQRQLGYYKEELKVWRKTQDILDGKKEESGAEMVHLPNESVPNSSTKPMAKDSKASAPPLPQVIHRFIPPPPAQQRYRPRNVQWQPHQNYPAMPALSPSMDYHDDYRYTSMPGSNMHPLDELMHRRKMYGPQSTMMQPPSASVRKRQDVVGTLENGMPPLERKDIKDEVISPSEDFKETNSFLSPDDTGSPADVNTAITPSPSSRSSGPQEHLPMKKRRKKSDSSPGSLGDASPGNNDIISPGDAKLSPFNFSPSEGIVMTPNGEAMIGQMMGMSPSLGQWNNESPFPYIDCYSPREGNGLYDTTNRPNPGYPASPYMPLGSWHPGSAPMSYQYSHDTNMPSAMNSIENATDSEAIDLDDEEVQLMRKLQATRAKKLMRKHQLMQQQHSWAMAVQSPGVLTHNYSFASPIEKTPAVEEKK